MKKSHNWPLLAGIRGFLALVVLACALWGLRPMLAQYQARPSSALVYWENPTTPPFDEIQIMSALGRVHTIHQAGCWFVGPWAHDSLAYYRPLTSVAWWLEFHAFGPNGLASFLVINAAVHVLACLLLFGFLCEMTGPGTAVLATCIFTVSAAHSAFGLPGSAPALLGWIDLPDLAASVFIIAALWAFLKYLRVDSSRCLSAAAVLFVVAAGWKETGYIAIPLFFALAWHEGKLRSRLMPLCIIAALSLFCLGFRHWALEGAQNEPLGNGAWMLRLLSNTVAGSGAAAVFSGDVLPAMAACACAAAAAAFVNRWRPCVVFMGVVVVCAMLIQREAPSFDDNQYLRLLVPEFWAKFAATLLLLGFWLHCARNRSRTQVFAYSWVVFSYMPLLTVQTTEHALYFVGIGWSLWFAVGIAEVAPRLLSRMKAARLTLHRAAAPSSRPS